MIKLYNSVMDSRHNLLSHALEHQASCDAGVGLDVVVLYSVCGWVQSWYLA